MGGALRKCFQESLELFDLRVQPLLFPLFVHLPINTVEEGMVPVAQGRGGRGCRAGSSLRAEGASRTGEATREASGTRLPRAIQAASR
jgi:hypothetical protein